MLEIILVKETHNCVVCGCRVRKSNKEMEYLGVVCSRCFRMSNEKYDEMVNKMAIKKIKLILDQIAEIKTKYQYLQSPFI